METHKNLEAQRAHAGEGSSHRDGAVPRETAAPIPEAPVSRPKGAKAAKNNVRKLRTDQMMSKAELARRAGVSTLTIDRVERGLSCRMDTKRKILEALGMGPRDREKVFGPDSADSDSE